MRIVFTGGSGKAGRYVIEHLLQQGHEILNLDVKPMDHPSVSTLIVNLCDGGEVFDALTGPFRKSEPYPEDVHPRPDAVIHFAAYPHTMIVPDTKTFENNTMATYNVASTACRLGVKKIIVASSVCVYGVTYANGAIDFPSFPIDEEVDCCPMDAYGMSKLCGETITRGLARKFNTDIYNLRIGAVIAPDEHDEKFKHYIDEPEKWKVHGWSYTDARDLGGMCEAALRTSGLGFQVFNATNDGITSFNKTEEFLRRQCPGVKFTRQMGESEAPMSNAKIKRLLGFREEHDFRKYVKGPGIDREHES